MSAHTDPEPPSPNPVHDHHAPTPITIPPRDMSVPHHNSNWSAPLASLAVQVAKLPDGPINALCGATAGIASGIVTCPLDVIKTRLQAQGSFRPRTYAGPTRAVYKGLMGTARIIWRDDGVRGLYRGLGPMLLGYIPTWAVYMSTYESTKDFLYPRMGQWYQRKLITMVLTDPDREQMACSDTRFCHSWRMLNSCHESNMGREDPAHVSSQLTRFRRPSPTVALQKHIRCFSKNVRQRRHHIFLFWPDARPSWAHACCHPVSSLRISKDEVYWFGNGSDGWDQ